MQRRLPRFNYTINRILWNEGVKPHVSKLMARRRGHRQAGVRGPRQRQTLPNATTRQCQGSALEFGAVGLPRRDDDLPGEQLPYRC
jgi:hypothetical protein